MKKMTVLKIALIVIALGFMAYLAYDMGAFVKLDPPATVKSK
jgi:hypothetical protein